MFSENLKRIRKEKGFTQQELAEAIGIHTSIISWYETGKSTPRMFLLECLCGALGVTATELLGF